MGGVGSCVEGVVGDIHPIPTVEACVGHQRRYVSNIVVGKSYLIINRSKEAPSEVVEKIIHDSGLELAGTIPDDQTIYEYDLNGRPTIEMPMENEALRAAFDIFEKVIK